MRTYGPCYSDGTPGIARCYICNCYTCEAHSAGYVLGMHLCNSCFTKLRTFFEQHKTPISVRDEIEKHASLLDENKDIVSIWNKEEME